MRGRVLGLEKEIAIDDYLPFYTWNKSLPYFAKQSPSGGMWASFLEKAWAKVNGNFEIVEGGWGHEVMRFITGAPTQSYYKGYNWATADEAWNILSQADGSNYVIMAGTPGTSDTHTVGNGLAASHAYTVLSVHRLLNTDGSLKARLLKMRNPWGNDGQYAGAWNDNDAAWTTAFAN